MALHESRAHRRLIISLLRNLLVKHSADLRYNNAVCLKRELETLETSFQTAQHRIATLYAPLVSVVLDNIAEFELVRRFETKEGQQGNEGSRNTCFPIIILN